MEITLSLVGFAKAFSFLVGSAFLAMVTLWPIGDRSSPSKGQVMVWGVLEVILFAVIFGFVSLNVVA